MPMRSVPNAALGNRWAHTVQTSVTLQTPPMDVEEEEEDAAAPA